MQKTLAAAGIAALALSVALTPARNANAQDGSPQAERQEIMKSVGDAMGVLGGMAKGERPYDAAAATQSLDVFIAKVPPFLELFPEGTETGHETRALPAIWENKADFDEKGEKLVAVAEASKGPAGESLDGLRSVMRDVGGACQACHETYRRPKN
ncbi:c-type cytochrome [Acuticoccus sediminis]|uniref:c-type cytochrome n=1 Tax=Acuticoccus sediminis TaxID=2184697 RepID=UPI001CFCD673|nr:cytochrome c [Acuticoccus sediminis]